MEIIETLLLEVHLEHMHTITITVAVINIYSRLAVSYVLSMLLAYGNINRHRRMRHLRPYVT